MSINTFEQITDILITTRGEEGCNAACEKLKTNFHVENVTDISEEKAKLILRKLANELLTKEAIETFEDVAEKSTACPVCGKEMVRKGMFMVCTPCRKIINA